MQIVSHSVVNRPGSEHARAATLAHGGGIEGLDPNLPAVVAAPIIFAIIKNRVSQIVSVGALGGSFVVVEFVAVGEVGVLLLCQVKQVVFVLLLLVFEAAHGCVHIDGKGDDNIQADDDAEIVENHEEVAVGGASALHVHDHGDNHVPVVDHDEHEERDEGGHQVVEVHQVVVVWDRGVVHDLWAVLLYLATEHNHARLREHVENRHHDQDQVVERAQQILERLENDAHGLDLVKEGEQLDHAHEDDDLANLHRVVVLLEVALAHDEADEGGNIEHLAQGLRPDPEVVPIRLDDARDRYVPNHLEQHDEVDCQLQNDPSVNLLLRRLLLQRAEEDSEHVEDSHNVHAQLVARRRDKSHGASIVALVLLADGLRLPVAVEILHGRFVLLFVEPGLIGLQEAHHLPRIKMLHVLRGFANELPMRLSQVAILLILLHEQLEGLLELQRSHVEIVALYVLALANAMHFLQNFFDAVFVDAALGGVHAEQPDEEVVPVLDVAVNARLHALLVVRVEDGEQQVQQHEQPDRQVDDEEEAVVALLPVRRQHDVREVRCRQQHEHVEEGVVQRREVLHALNRAREESVAHPSEVKHVDEDENHHR
mmetsp:Transcript_26389/g.30904  ORF Transcript_26389/g.30904 Transcript_26389/m.30904 type:complete len:597 (-) Transcript_26389:52-1842(-)|eukprot:CAMPEP_0185566894 /NCGR_PEP_ID=MMETSP0434-20130131/314_1 /TAXON_ID=626734 ORGANISM="Favella taraikaensis, Strain Fe Narragansett Bay" /NCGR_SAMPLE_ID=MMETSP0434 /ASSEMBLY_ACC=CAM_ASM_000379 /LENGTH=596 /DNA_ID=CAMNT_0028180951 /DNA_START=142 /DNA_END=1932 /DNA_ORIENTATION=-